MNIPALYQQARRAATPRTHNPQELLHDQPLHKQQQYYETLETSSLSTSRVQRVQSPSLPSRPPYLYAMQSNRAEQHNRYTGQHAISSTSIPQQEPSPESPTYSSQIIERRIYSQQVVPHRPASHLEGFAVVASKKPSRLIWSCQR